MSNDSGECQVPQTLSCGPRPRTLLWLPSTTHDRTWSEMPSHTALTCHSASLRCLCLGQTSTVFGFLEEEGGWKSECPLSSQQASCLCSSHICLKASEIPQWGRAFPASLPQSSAQPVLGQTWCSQHLGRGHPAPKQRTGPS